RSRRRGTGPARGRRGRRRRPPGGRVLLLVAHQRGRLLRVLRPPGPVGPRSPGGRSRDRGRRDRSRPAASSQRGRHGARHRRHRGRAGGGGGGLRRGFLLRPSRRGVPGRRRGGGRPPAPRRAGAAGSCPRRAPRRPPRPPAPAAVGAAAGGVAGLGRSAGPLADPPSSTFVSAVMTSEAAIVCWLGDSRAYWLATGPGAAAQQLTRDDSVAQELVAAGLLSEADALASAQVHLVTRWFGPGLTNPDTHGIRFE